MSTKGVLVKASEERERAIEELVESPALRANTKKSAGKISAACERLDGEGARLSIRNVVRELMRLFPDEYPAESSIRNSTASGKIYRGIIEAWRVYQIARSPVPVRLAQEGIDADLPDSMLLAIQPETTRLAVLLMRTALRNIRRQFQLLQSLSAERLVRSGPGMGSYNGPAELLTGADLDVIKNFLDEKQCRARGANWNGRGQLTDEQGNSLSEPGLQDTLLRVIALSGARRRFP